MEVKQNPRSRGLNAEDLKREAEGSGGEGRVKAG